MVLDSGVWEKGMQGMKECLQLNIPIKIESMFG